MKMKMEMKSKNEYEDARDKKLEINGTLKWWTKRNDALKRIGEKKGRENK